MTTQRLFHTCEIRRLRSGAWTCTRVSLYYPPDLVISHSYQLASSTTYFISIITDRCPNKFWLLLVEEMHPPDLNMLETNSGLRGSDGSFSGKAQVTSSNSTLGTLLSPFDITEYLCLWLFQFNFTSLLGYRNLNFTDCRYGWSVDNVW